MTIKKRLFISNILMIVVPILVSMIGGALVITLFKDFIGDHRGNTPLNNEYFYNGMERTSELAEQLSGREDLEEIKEVVSAFNEKWGSATFYLSIYEGNELRYPASSTENSVTNVLQEDISGHLLIIDSNAIYKEDIGRYSLILEDSNFPNKSYDTKNIRGYVLNVGRLIFLSVMAIILLTNWFLTRFIIKSILIPLDTLAYGVHQIGDGNLDYRITHERQDEFASICSDFNEMAERLLDSVNATQRDEENRKELIAGISHDLRTPLTSIKAYVEGLEKGIPATIDAQKRYFDTIKSKTNDLEQIINKLFMFSKLDIGEFPFHLEYMNVGKELQNIISKMADEYEKKGLQITMTENLKNVIVHIDIVQFCNAVTNILENSVKYKNKEKGSMEICCIRENNQVIITFQDDGPGVSDKAIGKLFNVFYRSDPSRRNPSNGSGLGLAITAKILARLGGTIHAKNVTSGGLSIIMTIPIAREVNKIEEDFNYRR